MGEEVAFVGKEAGWAKGVIKEGRCMIAQSRGSQFPARSSPMHTADRETDGVVTLQSVGGGEVAGGFSETQVSELFS